VSLYPGSNPCEKRKGGATSVWAIPEEGVENGELAPLAAIVNTAFSHYASVPLPFASRLRGIKIGKRSNLPRR